LFSNSFLINNGLLHFKPTNLIAFKSWIVNLKLVIDSIFRWILNFNFTFFLWILLYRLMIACFICFFYHCLIVEKRSVSLHEIIIIFWFSLRISPLGVFKNLSRFLCCLVHLILLFLLLNCYFAFLIPFLLQLKTNAS
jgi:hypothetical protein